MCAAIDAGGMDGNGFGTFGSLAEMAGDRITQSKAWPGWFAMREALQGKRTLRNIGYREALIGHLIGHPKPKTLLL